MTPVTLPPIVAPTDPVYALERYSTRQAAAYLHVSQVFLYRTIRRGRIACQQLEAERRPTYRFSQRDLDQFRAGLRREVRDVTPATTTRHAQPRRSAPPAASAGLRWTAARQL